MCEQLKLQLLEQLPHDPRLAEYVDRGEEYYEKFKESVIARSFAKLAEKVTSILK